MLGTVDELNEKNLLKLAKTKFNISNRFVCLRDLVIALTEHSNALDYTIIRPILLSIPSFTSPYDFFRALLDRYHAASSIPGAGGRAVVYANICVAMSI